MTPSTIFQWPLSPSGTFQPVKSLPLNREVNPCGALPSSARQVWAAKDATTARSAQAKIGFIVLPFVMGRDRALRLKGSTPHDQGRSHDVLHVAAGGDARVPPGQAGIPSHGRRRRLAD